MTTRRSLLSWDLPPVRRPRPRLSLWKPELPDLRQAPELTALAILNYALQVAVDALVATNRPLAYPPFTGAPTSAPASLPPSFPSPLASRTPSTATAATPNARSQATT